MKIELNMYKLYYNADIINGMPHEDFDYEFIKIKFEESKTTCWYWRYEKWFLWRTRTSLISFLEEVYNRKMAPCWPYTKSEIEKILYLQILDTAWREHLYSMDTLKTGIGFKGYNQKTH